MIKLEDVKFNDRYKDRLMQDMTYRDYYHLYSRDFELGKGKYTVKEAQEKLMDAYENCINNKLYPKEILCSVEFFDSLKRKITDKSIMFQTILLKVVWNQKEDIILK